MPELVIQAILIAALSTMQISFYIPVRTKPRCVLFFLLLAADTLGTQLLFSGNAGHYTYFAGCIAMAAVVSGTAVWLCKTAVYCGIYNVVIQLCINLIAIKLASTLSSMLFISSAAQAGLRTAVIVLAEAAWCIVMYRLKQKLWVHMPQPDEYYLWVMIFIIIDYLILLPYKSSLDIWEIVHIIICLLILILILYAIWLPQLIIEEKNRSEMVRYQQKAMRNYTEWYLGRENEMRTIRHDIRHVLNAAEELMLQNETGTVRKLTEAARKSLDLISEPGYCDNVLINAVLRDYSGQFECAGIPFEIVVRLPDAVRIADLDVTTLLHNILSNALEYSVSMKNTDMRHASVTILTARNYFCVICENALEEEIEIGKGSRIKSHKAGAPGTHGIGLDSIRSTVRKYDGEMHIKAEGGRFKLTAMLLNRAVSE